MSVPRPRYAFADNAVPSLADVHDIVSDSRDPAVVRRRPQLLTSLNRLARHTGIDAAVTPFVPPVLRAALARYTPARSGLSKKSIQNDHSNLRFLLDHLGLGGLRQYQVPLSGSYMSLFERLDDRHLKAGLSRFLRFAQVHGIALQDIDDAFADQFRHALEAEGVLRDPAQSGRQAIKAWNKAVARFPELSLQRLTSPTPRRGWGLRWAELPASLRAQVDAYFEARSVAGNLFDPTAPDVILRPRTIKTQKDWLRTLASAAVCGGIPQTRLQTLAALIQPATVETALQWYIEVKNANLTEFPVMLAVQALTVAKALGVASAEEIERLQRLIRRLRRFVETAGESSRRLDRLAQFEDRRNQLRMLALSTHVMTTLPRLALPPRRAALLVQMALVHELFLATSLRCGNVAALDLDRHMQWVETKDGRRCLIRIPGQEVKNGESLHKELPDHVTALLETYLTHWRPNLTQAPSTWLLPGRRRSHKGTTTLTQQYKAFMSEWTGLDVTPHLMRSFGDLIYTERHPEGGEVMRRQLGHRSAETRLKHYADPRGRAAGRAFQALLHNERGTALDQVGLFEGGAPTMSAPTGGTSHKATRKPRGRDRRTHD